MPNALDTFKAQQKALETLLARLTDVVAGVSDLAARLEALRTDRELHATLEAEQRWIAKTQDVLRDVRQWQERQSRALRWSGVWQWTKAIAFALAVSVATAAGFMWARQLYAVELARLQSQAALADLVDRRVAAMTPGERQQFERLLNLSEKPRHEGSR